MASYEVIQAAYRALARRYHPDVAPGPEAAARMAQLNTAWELLRDEDKRAEYDQEHADGGGWGRSPSGGRTSSSSQPGSGASGPGSWSQRSSGSPAGGGSPGRAAAGGSPGAGGATRNGTQPGRAGSPSVEWRVGPEGVGAAGPPPGHPSGSVVDFGRHIGWSLGEIGRVDPGYLVWLVDRPEGRRYRDEIQEMLRRSGSRQEPTGASKKGGRFSR